MNDTQSKIYWKVFDVINSSRLPYHLNGADRVIGFSERYLTPELVSKLKRRRAEMSYTLKKLNNFINSKT